MEASSEAEIEALASQLQLIRVEDGLTPLTATYIRLRGAFSRFLFQVKYGQDIY